MTGLRTLAALAVLAQLGTAQAASFALEERQAQEAVEFGERSVQRDGFGDEWRVRNPAGDAAIVMTPFHRLALAARHAAFRKEPLKPRERDRVLKQQQDRWCSGELTGPREDFARLYAPASSRAGPKGGDLQQNERTAARRPTAGSSPAASTASNQGALRQSKVVLVVRDGDGRDVSSFTST